MGCRKGDLEWVSFSVDKGSRLKPLEGLAKKEHQNAIETKKFLQLNPVRVYVQHPQYRGHVSRFWMPVEVDTFLWTLFRRSF